MLFHVLPGDAAAENFSDVGVGGEIVVCRECLIEGDVKSENPDDFWRVRAGFIKQTYGGNADAYFKDVASEFERLQKAAKGDQINLWFEYELFCQVNMWFCLYLLSETEADVYRVAPVVRTEETLWKGFGNLSGEEMRRCFEERVKFTDDDVLLGENLWTAYRDGNFDELNRLSRAGSACFPRLREVCRAEIEKQYRPKKVLERIIAQGETDFGKIFAAFTAEEGVYGFGDAQVKRILQEI